MDEVETAITYPPPFPSLSLSPRGGGETVSGHINLKLGGVVASSPLFRPWAAYPPWESEEGMGPPPLSHCPKWWERGGG